MAGTSSINPLPYSSTSEGHNVGMVSSHVEDLFTLLESSGKPSAVQEVKQLINEQYNEVKEPWLVNGLYDTFCSTKSPKCLELLLNVRQEPHDRFLCDRICEAIKQGGKQRNLGFEVMGYVIRKQPSWLYRITQHTLMKEWIKTLKTEDDIVIMLSGVLNLLALLPVLPAYIAQFLGDIFDIFSRLASWRIQSGQRIPEIQHLHIEVALYAFFHRLYGMFPCNFLSYLRQQFSNDVSKESQAVFSQTIRPMLSTVRMHPLLVTHSREHEKTSTRWKRMEVHDVIVESSRYSLLSQECTREELMDDRMLDISEAPPPSPFVSIPFFVIPPPIEKNQSALPQSMTITTKTITSTTITGGGGTLIDASTIDQNLQQNVLTGAGNLQSPGIAVHSNSMGGKNLPPSRLTVIESPPETAIEATPETTPFVTPVKDDSFRFTRPAPSSQVTRQLNLDATTDIHSPNVHNTLIKQTSGNIYTNTSDFPLPVGPADRYSIGGQTSVVGSFKQPNSKLPSTTPTSPLKDPSPFRFPELPHHAPGTNANIGSTAGNQLVSSYERRDSLFERTDQLGNCNYFVRDFLEQDK